MAPVQPAGQLRRPNSSIHAAAVTPNDPYYTQLWGLNNANNVDIDAPEAWQITQDGTRRSWRYSTRGST